MQGTNITSSRKFSTANGSWCHVHEQMCGTNPPSAVQDEQDEGLPVGAIHCSICSVASCHKCGKFPKGTQKRKHYIVGKEIVHLCSQCYALVIKKLSVKRSTVRRTPTK